MHNVTENLVVVVVVVVVVVCDPFFPILPPNAHIFFWSWGKTSLCFVVYFIGSLLAILARRGEEREMEIWNSDCLCAINGSCWRRESRSMASSSCPPPPFFNDFPLPTGHALTAWQMCRLWHIFSSSLSQSARESHQSLTRPRSRGGQANMGKILCTFHNFPFAGIFGESVPIVQVAWTQPGQIINRCWEIKKNKRKRGILLVMRRLG